LLSFSSHVEKDSTLFKQSFHDSVLHIKKNPALPDGIAKEHIQKIYSEKLAKHGSVGRKYYDRILSEPKYGLCPICGVRTVKELDHYMPKSIYYTLIVTPENLIPICKDCNYEKRAYTISDIQNAILHPYFDDINDDIWLTVNLQSIGAELVVSYNVNNLTERENLLQKRLEKHFEVYKLNKFFTAQAANEIANKKMRWLELLKNVSPEEFQKCLISNCNSIGNNGLNSWKAALYRGLITQFQELVAWLEKNV